MVVGVTGWQVYEDSVAVMVVGVTGWQVYEDSVELQLYFMQQRDELCRRGEVLLSPALSFTVDQFTADVDQQRLLRDTGQHNDDDHNRQCTTVAVKTASAQVRSTLWQ